MCGRYTNTLAPGALEQRFGVSFPSAEGTRRYNIAPTEPIVAVVRERDGDAGARVVRWGLLPWWSKDRRGAARMINARVETVLERSAYRDLVAGARGRALIPADGWFEWLRAEDPRQPRRPFRFTVDDGGPFAFAGLWTSAKIDGERVETATIITTSAASIPLAAAIHDRMPVVLVDREAEQAWLSEELGGPAALALCGTVSASRLHVTPANPRVNRAGLDDEGPDLLVA